MGYSISGPNKIITLTTGTTSVSVRDLWSRWVDWFLTGDNSKYLPAFENVGGNDIDLAEGTKIPVYAFLVNGWKLKPQESNHTLTIKDGVLLVNGGGDPFNNTTGAYVVRVNYQQPVQAISFTVGGVGGSAPTVEEIREELDINSIKLQELKILSSELHKIQGLDITSPMTATKTTRIAGDIELQITGDGKTVTTVTRV